jgi:hypothetical protein
MKKEAMAVDDAATLIAMTREFNEVIKLASSEARDL